MRGETIQVLTAATVADPYGGEPVIDWTAEPDVRDVELLAPPEPRPSFRNDEPIMDARNRISSGWTLYLPPGDPINTDNRVRVRGQDFPVRGVPAHWPKGVVVQAFTERG